MRLLAAVALLVGLVLAGGAHAQPIAFQCLGTRALLLDKLAEPPANHVLITLTGKDAEAFDDAIGAPRQIDNIVIADVPENSTDLFVALLVGDCVIEAGQMPIAVINQLLHRTNA